MVAFVGRYANEYSVWPIKRSISCLSIYIKRALLDCTRHATFVDVQMSNSTHAVYLT